MGNRLSRIVTKTGDDGTTGIAGNIRLPKYDPRIETIGTIDELNALIGIGIAHLESDNLPHLMEEWLTIQHYLFNVGGELAMPEHPAIDEQAIAWLEERIVHYNQSLPPLKEFILPSGSLLISQTHAIRALTRSGERMFAYLIDYDQHAVNPLTLQWLNRLSDYFFIMARYIAKESGIQEVYWQSERLKRSS